MVHDALEAENIALRSELEAAKAKITTADAMYRTVKRRADAAERKIAQTREASNGESHPAPGGHVRPDTVKVSVAAESWLLCTTCGGVVDDAFPSLKKGTPKHG
jgi:hypothetical protein